MKKKFYLILMVMTISCENSPTKKVLKSGKNGIVRSYYDQAEKQIKAEVTMKDGKKNGPAIQYYKNGKKALEMNYLGGDRDGLSTRYFENGKVSQQTTFVKDKMHGLQKKFRDSGKFLSEATFFNDQPCKGLKEYYNDGTLKAEKDYPRIVVKPIDRIFQDATYVLKVSLSEKANEVEFFTGSLTEQKCIGNKASKAWSLTGTKGEADLIFTLPPGSLIMEKINIIAKFKTINGNFYIRELPYNLAIENRN
jgi:hypothetical protein